MSALEIICIIGISFTMFILGRITKKSKFLIAGELNFLKTNKEGVPTVIFTTNLRHISKFNYVVFRIRGRINDDNERHDV